MLDKKLIDTWSEKAGELPHSTRQEIMAAKKSGKSVREISSTLELAPEVVSMVLIEGFAVDIVAGLLTGAHS